MPLFKATCVASAIACGFAILVSINAFAGAGHDHGPGAAATTAVPASPRVTAVSEAYELVGILKAGRLVIYLDRRADTSPVTAAQVELTIDGEAGVADPQPDGTYVLTSATFAKPGTKEVIISIVENGRSDLLIGTLDEAHANNARAATDTVGHDHAISDGGMAETLGAAQAAALVDRLRRPPVLISLGLVFGVLIGALMRGRSSVAVTGIAVLLAVLGAGSAWAGAGHDHGAPAAAIGKTDAPRRQPDGSLFLPKPTQRLLEIRTRVVASSTARSAQRIIGRVISDPNRSGLVQGTIGGRIRAPKGGLPVLGQAVKAGQTLAYLQPAFTAIDASDVGQTAGDLDQRMAVLQAKIKRQQKLVDRQVASRASLQDFKIELKGLQARRAQLVKSRVEPELLKAPVDGVIAEVRVVAGQVVTNADTLFHIVDPRSLWVEAISFDPRLAIGISAARAKSPDGQFFDLAFVGRSLALQQQSTVLHFRIEKPPEALSIGTPVKVLIETGSPVTGIIVPRNAVAQAPNGQMVVFKRLAPERYAPAPVRIDDFDGERVHIMSGLKPGDQIIVRNAPLVNQIR